MKFITLLIAILTIVQTSAYAQREGAMQRDLLVNEINRLNLGEILITDHSWIDVPGYDDRSFWEAIPETMRENYIQRAEEYLDYDWPAVKATTYLQVLDSDLLEELPQSAFYDGRARRALQALYIGELVEGRGRFIDQIINGVWYHCEQTWWEHGLNLYEGYSHLNWMALDGLPDPDVLLIGLRSGAVAAMLSWIHYFFEDTFDEIHPLINRRLKEEVMNKVVNPFMERDLFFWWWMGWEDEYGTHHVNNWVPNVYNKVLTSILLLEDDPQRKIEGVQRILRGLDVYINTFPDDGGIDEGPGYWGGAIGNLYKSLRMLESVTGGQLNIFDHPLIQNMGRYMNYAYIADPYFLNFADARPTSGGGGGRGVLLYRYGKTINDDVLQRFGAYLAQSSNWGRTSGGSFDEEVHESAFNPEFVEEVLSAPAEKPLLNNFWLPQTGIGGARDEAGTEYGFYFAAKGGTNHESHNHNDVGSFMFYVDGKPCLIDVGTDTYMGGTFREGRYEIWNLQSQYHNLPKVNGVDQVAGNEYKAQNTDFVDDGQKAVFTTNIAGAYPEEARVRSWVRSYTLDRGREFVVSDRYELEEVKDGPTTLNFITATQVSQNGPGKLSLEGEGFTMQMEYDETKATAQIEVLDLVEMSNSLHRTWPQGLTRVVLRLNDPGLTESFDTIFTRNN